MSQSSNKFHKIRYQEIDFNHEAYAFLKGFEYEDIIAPFDVIVCEGDLHIQSDMPLDYDNYNYNSCNNLLHSLDLAMDKTQDVVCLIVLGNLTVDGSILNSDSGEGVRLVVSGTINAKNMLAGGTYIYTAQSIVIAEVLYGYYNDGAVMALEEIQATLFINDNHDLEAKQYRFACEYDPGNIDNFGVEESYIITDDDSSLPIRFKEYLKAGIRTKEEILAHLKQGKSVLK